MKEVLKEYDRDKFWWSSRVAEFIALVLVIFAPAYFVWIAT